LNRQDAKDAKRDTQKEIRKIFSFSFSHLGALGVLAVQIFD